eukprot:CAMPEP_0113943124 /NCGR_PEP_ID=MMETSP1339-20121228/19191_1 /TAXON_ID=94617 /ORGANISM="Fibrocapsa japonica" /LENGTH=501 /DNA_ID=CAMNT_0000947901 /DNA_START=20 /DNA_END=1525 /DNA_ORIENTATION=+ /assembly_acc=CAM_ASM_000762
MASIVRTLSKNISGSQQEESNGLFPNRLIRSGPREWNVARCEKPQQQHVEDLLAEIYQRVKTLEGEMAVHGATSKNKGPATVDVVLGAQWGDEGKGKLVDLLTHDYSICARVAGGSNAGHTIVVDGVTYKFHLIPSGMLNPEAVCVVGNGVVVHVPTMLKELEALDKAGINWRGRFFISDRAHLVFDFHQTLDGITEERLGRNKIGTTKKGIGPAYASKINRNGVRFGDLRFMNDFEDQVKTMVAAYKMTHPEMKVDIEKELAFFRKHRALLLELTTDTVSYINEKYDKGHKILIEGANATMLDVDFGTYPYVTSSNPSVGSVCTGLGIAPVKLSHIWGTVKAYCTRVGEGPFPTELLDALGEEIRKVGHEYGTTTGRPRRCGWLDIPQMRYSCQINGFTALILTKLDVLTGLDEIKIGTRYVYNGKVLKGMPSNLQILSGVEVQYETLPGWKEDITKIRNFEDLPEAAKAYVLRVEQLIGTPIRWIGVGPGRDEVIDRHA